MSPEMDNKKFVELVELTYDELLRVAQRTVRLDITHELTPEDLLQDVYLRLRDTPQIENLDRLSFLRLAAMTMRRLLLDHARSSRSGKRGRGPSSAHELSLESIGFGESLVGPSRKTTDFEILALNTALTELGKLSPIQAEVVETRFFGGFTASETASALGLSETRVEHEWRKAKAWLRNELAPARQTEQGEDAETGTRRPVKYEQGADKSNATVVRVFFATDRKQASETSIGPAYGTERSPSGVLQYGECEISIPNLHKKGNMESPSLLRLEFRPDPQKHIVLVKVENQAEALFFERLANSVKRSDARDAFVFVHGFNVSFEDAARRAGQIAFDLEFICAPVFYSWPSNGRVADYVRDETEITWTAPHFERFLVLLSQYSGAKRIHIVAHSMGNRAVCEALKHLGNARRSRLKFNHLLLAAPDIDAGTFEELADSLKKLSGRITLYESSNDKALKISRKIHRYQRAGEPLLVIPGVDTVDASTVDTDFLGHSYYSKTWPLLADMHSLLSKDEPPGKRFGLVEIRHQMGKYYAFRS